MRRSTDYFLSTHGGNLPLPDDLTALIANAKDNEAAIAAELPKAVDWVVAKQIECGVDILNDGEYVKASHPGTYAAYIFDRMSGFNTVDRPAGLQPKRGFSGERDLKDFPGFYESGLWFAGSGGAVRPGFAKPGSGKPAISSPTPPGCAPAPRRSSIMAMTRSGKTWRRSRRRLPANRCRRLHRRARPAQHRRRHAQFPL
jgi:hypothetical protein